VAGAGRTLLPGLIDAHAHSLGDTLRNALVFGVTTELDMPREGRGCSCADSWTCPPTAEPTHRPDLPDVL